LTASVAGSLGLFVLGVLLVFIFSSLCRAGLRRISEIVVDNQRFHI
jgi:cell division septal protein FtsQ